jgi:hypothetical protein
MGAKLETLIPNSAEDSMRKLGLNPCFREEGVRRLILAAIRAVARADDAHLEHLPGREIELTLTTGEVFILRLHLGPCRRRPRRRQQRSRNRVAANFQQQLQPR